MRRFRKRAGVPEGGWEGRLGDKFALAYAALGHAVEMGLVPFSEAAALKALMSCYRDARSLMADDGATMSRVMNRLHKRLTSGEGILDLRPGRGGKANGLDPAAAKAFVKRAGDGSVVYLIKAAAFERWVAPLSAKLVLEEFRKRGHAPVTARRSHWLQAQVASIAGRRSYACISTSFLAQG
jgi:hypothetical protein